MYVDASQSCNDLSMQLASDGSQMWTITVSQYECDYENLAPPGCTQYYWGSNTGVIKVIRILKRRTPKILKRVICGIQESVRNFGHALDLNH